MKNKTNKFELHRPTTEEIETNIELKELKIKFDELINKLPAPIK